MGWGAERLRLDCYAFKCTAASSGNDQLPDFRGAARHHFIATTVDLLTTGVDVPGVRNIVFFKYVRSPIGFYQMIGRGARIDAASGKLMFTIYDYTGVTELFGEAFITRPAGDSKGKGGASPEYHPILVEGFDVHVTDGGRFVVIQDGGQAKPIPLEEYKSRLARRLVAEAPTLEEFRQRWIQPRERRQLLDRVLLSGCSPAVWQMLTEMNDYDLYDVLADLGFSLLPLTRQELASAFIYKHEDWLQGLPPPSAPSSPSSSGAAPRGWKTRSCSRHRKSGRRVVLRRCRQEASRRRSCCGRPKSGCLRREVGYRTRSINKWITNCNARYGLPML